jgi:protein gp37
MAESSPGDVLTGDWNPFVGCVRYSPGCARCWFLDGIYPWQQRLKNIPADQAPDDPLFFPKRWTEQALAAKNGIVGVCQHGDLFWDRITDEQIHKTLDIVDAVAPKKIARRRRAGLPAPKYVLWTKRVERMCQLMIERYHKARFGNRVPDWYGLGASLENQKLVDRRLPALLRVNGFRIAILEPILGPVDLSAYIGGLDWVIVGSETGGGAWPADPDWFRHLRDVTKAAGKPFFVKQLGTSHKAPERELDGRTWDEFPAGYVKQVKNVTTVR